MQLYMENANLRDAYNNGEEYTLDYFFRRTLCLFFQFPPSQCDQPIDTISPAPTTSPTLEPTWHPTIDPTLGIIIRK